MKELTEPHRAIARLPWHKHLAFSWKRLSRLYAVPEPLPYTRLSWLALGLVSGAVLLFCGFFIFYLTSRHMAYITNAEDLGIMDQAIWNTLHGHSLHQTICNTISDTNCAGLDGVERFAIHFEPLLFPIALLYLLWPDPCTLLIFQTIVVGLGAFPAFWLARLRLRNELAALAVALLYLLYPAQQQATTFDFHAVTLTSTLLLCALYFLYTRRTALLLVCVALAMGCKEQIPLIVIMLGGWTLVFQQRWRLGLVLILAGALWFVLAIYVIMPHFSPTGQPMLIGRYEGAGKHPFALVQNLLNNPVGFLKQYALDSDHRTYLRILLLPALYLPLLAPWVLILAAPSLMLNMLSSNKQMYSGLFQYNAEIVPILIFALVEGLLCLQWMLRLFMDALKPLYRQIIGGRVEKEEARWHDFLRGCLLGTTLVLALLSTLRYDYRFHGQMPFARDFQWPTFTRHTALAQEIFREIPEDASLSAQSHLVPHLSQREKIYLFPYGNKQAEYVLLDVTGDVYPYYGPDTYFQQVRRFLARDDYGIVDAHDGYLLFKRGQTPAGLAFCSTLTPESKHRQGTVLASLLNDVCTGQPQVVKDR